jgi:hypothetical protein
MAILRALDAVASHPEWRRVCIAPDSAWATGACLGETRNAHRTLVRKARDRLAKASEGRTILWGWVKGHSKHTGNDRADALADEGRERRERETKGPEEKTEPARGSAERGRKTRAGRSRRGTRAGEFSAQVDEEGLKAALRSAQWTKKAATVRERAVRTEAGLQLRAEYWRTHAYGRRNARGTSVQFMERPLRQLLFGKHYVEADVVASHPTMAATAMRWAGVQSRAWESLATDPGAYRGQAVEEYRRMGITVRDDDVKQAITVLLNGGSTSKWARETIGREIVADSITALRAGIRAFREKASEAYPDVRDAVEADGRSRTREERKTAVVYAVMTGLEDRVLEAMEEAAAGMGWECAALMGDGLLVRPRNREWPDEWGAVCRAWQGTVLSRTGVHVRLKFKTLEGESADPRSSHTRRPPGA